MNVPRHLCAWACAAAAAVACVASAGAQSAAAEKKIVAFGWEFGQVTTISNLLLYADRFDQTPLSSLVHPVSSSAPVITAPSGTSERYTIRASSRPAFRGVTFSR